LTYYKEVKKIIGHAAEGACPIILNEKLAELCKIVLKVMLQR